jgi:hypothetical protein
MLDGRRFEVLDAKSCVLLRHERELIFGHPRWRLSRIGSGGRATGLVIELDVVPAALELASQRFENRHVEGELVVGDETDLVVEEGGLRGEEGSASEPKGGSKSNSRK